MGWVPGGRVGAYLLGERLGVGGMGSVWSARHETTGAERALKRVIAPSYAHSERFAREGEALGRLQHPNVLRVHESFEVGNDLVLVTERAQGDLAKRLRAGPLEEAATVEICVALAGAVQAAHSVGILHRDLKPANVLLGDEGRPLLGDFGLARIHDRASLTETGGVLGTPAYIPPEAAQGRRSDERSDVYGLGAILYHCLRGQPPFAESSPIATLAAVIREVPPPLVGTTPALVAVCTRAMAKDPAERFPTAEAFGSALAKALEAEPEPPRALWPLVAVVLVALLGLALTLAFVERPFQQSASLAPTLPRATQPRIEPSLSPTPAQRVLRPRGTTRVVSAENDTIQAVWLDDTRFVVAADGHLQIYRCRQRGTDAIGRRVPRPGRGELQLFHGIKAGVLLGGQWSPLCYVPLSGEAVPPLSEATEQVVVAEVPPAGRRTGWLWIGGATKIKAVDLATGERRAQFRSPLPNRDEWELRALTQLSQEEPVGFYSKLDKTDEALVVWKIGSEPQIRTSLGVGGRSATLVKGVLWAGTTDRRAVPFSPDFKAQTGALRISTFANGRLRAIVGTQAGGRVFALSEYPAELYEFGAKGGAPERTIWKGRAGQRGWALSLSPDEEHLLVTIHPGNGAPGEILLVSLNDD